MSNPEYRKGLELSEIEKEAVALFKKIQAYSFSTAGKPHDLSLEEEYAHTRRTKSGSCTAKHNLLAAEFTNLGLNTRFVTYPFYWQDLPVKYPSKIQELVVQMPLQYHLALNVCFKEDILLIDATWDPSLRAVGFPVGGLRDNLSSTPLGIVPAGSAVIHTYAEQRRRYIDEIKRRSGRDPLVGDFYNMLDDWLQSIRKILGAY